MRVMLTVCDAFGFRVVPPAEHADHLSAATERWGREIDDPVA